MSADVPSVERLRELPLDSLRSLVDESEREGFRFVSRLLSEWRSGANRFERPGEALFAARDGDSLLGIAGLNVDPYQDDTRVARLRHVYVRADSRRKGIGRLLVARALAHASSGPFIKVRLRTDTLEGTAFYEALGFGRCLAGSGASHERAP